MRQINNHCSLDRYTLTWGFCYLTSLFIIFVCTSFLPYPEASSYGLYYSHSRLIAPVLKGGTGPESDLRHGTPVIQREVIVHDEFFYGISWPSKTRYVCVRLTEQLGTNIILSRDVVVLKGGQKIRLLVCTPAPTVVRCKFAQPLSGESRIFSYSTTALWKSGLGLNNHQPSPEYAESPKINADKEERRVREALYSSGWR